MSLFTILPARADDITSDLKVVMLGTGNPMSNPERSGPAVAIISHGKSYIIDSGVGVVRRAVEASRRGISELAPKNLTRVFLTHLHSDHTAGLANMILTPWVLRRTEPLNLYGPPGTKHLADGLIDAYKQDIDMRLHGTQPANADGYKVNSFEFSKEGIIFEDENVTVEAIANNHGTWQYTFGYKFTEKSSAKTVVISGDTTYSENIVKAAMGADILVHEIMSQIALSKRSDDWQKYHAAFHTSPKQMVKIANRAKPRLLVLYHQQYWDKADDHLAQEVKAAGYQGDVISANDLDVFE